MTTQLTTEQIDERIATMNLQITLNDEARQRMATRSALLRASIAELEAQRPKDLYVVVDRENDLFTEPAPLIDALGSLRRANTDVRFAPYTIHKLTPCNDDGSVRS